MMNKATSAEKLVIKQNQIGKYCSDGFIELTQDKSQIRIFG